MRCGVSPCFFDPFSCIMSVMDITDIQGKIGPVLKRNRVKRAGVFGSVARGEKSPRDVDILVEMPESYSLFSFLSLKEELQDVIGQRVDLVEYSHIKPPLRESILRDEVKIL